MSIWSILSSLQKVQKEMKIKIQSLWMCSKCRFCTFRNSEIDFMENLSDRKIMKFSHCCETEPRSIRKYLTRNRKFTVWRKNATQIYAISTVDTRALLVSQCGKTRNSLSLKYISWNQLLARTLLSRNFWKKKNVSNFP